MNTLQYLARVNRDLRRAYEEQKFGSSRHHMYLEEMYKPLVGLLDRHKDEKSKEKDLITRSKEKDLITFSDNEEKEKEGEEEEEEDLSEDSLEEDKMNWSSFSRNQPDSIGDNII